MSNELDPGLRRLFASTAERPADEAFVSAVAARTAGLNWRAPIVRGLATALFLAVAAAGLGLVVDQGARAILPLLNPSPASGAVGLGLVIAGVICFRLLEPLVSRRS